MIELILQCNSPMFHFIALNLTVAGWDMLGALLVVESHHIQTNTDRFITLHGNITRFYRQGILIAHTFFVVLNDAVYKRIQLI